MNFWFEKKNEKSQLIAKISFSNCIHKTYSFKLKRICVLKSHSFRSPVTERWIDDFSMRSTNCWIHQLFCCTFQPCRASSAWMQCDCCIYDIVNSISLHSKCIMQLKVSVRMHESCSNAFDVSQIKMTTKWMANCR